MNHLLRILGYSGLNDRTKSVNVMALDAKNIDDMEEVAQEPKDVTKDVTKLAEDVARKLQTFRVIWRRVRIKTNSVTAELC